MQTNFLVDDHQWLWDANRLLVVTKSVHVTNSLMQTVHRAYQITWWATMAYFVFCFGSIAIHSYWHHYGLHLGFVIGPGVICAHTYYSGLPISQFYILNKASVVFLKQFGRRVQVRLRDATKLEDIHAELQEFSRVYKLIQYLKIYIKRAYLSSAFSAFMCALCMFYMTFYSSADFGVKVMMAISTSLLLMIVNFFSYFPGKVDIEAREISEIVYRKFNVRPSFGLMPSHSHFLSVN